MSQIKNDKTAKMGLSGLLGGHNVGTDKNEEGLTFERGRELSKEEILDSMSNETRESLQKEIQRRQYLKAGRPPKGSDLKTKEYTRMTFLVSPEKQDKLRTIALKKGLFLKEVLDRAIDLVIEEFDKEDGI